MNEGGYALIILCALAAMTKDNARVRFGSFGLLMLGHYFATWQLSVENFGLAYLSSAALCSYLVLTLRSQKGKDFVFLSLVCGACVLTNVLGYALWDNSLSIALYDDLYFGIYIVTILYLIPKAYHDRANKAVGAARNFLRAIAYNYNRHLGSGQ